MLSSFINLISDTVDSVSLSIAISLNLIQSYLLMMASSEVVKSLEPFQGLPTYQNGKISNLTAIVTGANGMSGYHMVRVLTAAPERWSKIYCLSRRPPPINFYEDLGEGATRVEHIAIDFLGHESKIATQIKERISKVYALHSLYL